MAPSDSLLKLLRSPCHRADLDTRGETLRCASCGAAYPLVDGVPSVIEGQQIPLTEASEAVEVSVLILARDEQGNIGRQLQETAAVLDDIGVRFELLVVDGNSRDGTVEEALSAGARVERQREPGYGNAFRQGLSLCAGTWILTLDADGSHDPNFLRAVWAQRESAEVVIASRYAGGEARMPYSRQLLSRFLNGFVGRLLALPVKDLSSGYRLYRRSALADLELVGRDFNVLIELLTKLYLRGYGVREVPFFYKPRGEGRSKAVLLRFAGSYLGSCWSLWRIRNSTEAADYDGRAYRSLVYPQRYWQQKRFEILTRMLAGQNSGILDVGCGSSKIIQFLPGAVGLDSNLSKLRFIRRFHTQIVHGTLRGLPFADETFQTVICSHVVDRIPDTTSALSELLRVLKPGGRLILGAPDYGGWQWPFIERIYQRVTPAGRSRDRHTHLTRDGLVHLLESLGATCLEEDYILKAEWMGMFRKNQPR